MPTAITREDPRGSQPHHLDERFGLYLAGVGMVAAMEYDGSGNLIFYGIATPGSSQSATVWQIRRFLYSGTNPTDMQWAGGTTSFKWAWSGRAGLSYS